METKDLDKLLDELAICMEPLDLVPTSCIPQGVEVAREAGTAASKLRAFLYTKDVMSPPEKWGAREVYAKGVADFCERVALYYMLKGCGHDSEIAENKELYIITRLLT